MSTVKPAVKSRGDEILGRIAGIDSPVIAEVGVAEGNLSRYLLMRCKDLIVYMIDNWLDGAMQPQRYKDTRDNNAHVAGKKQQDRISAAYAVAEKNSGRAKIIRMDSVLAAGRCPDRLDLVFIDADHSYEGVKADIEAWCWKVRPGGWLGGHDYANKDPRFDFGVQQAVDEIFQSVERGANYTWWVRV